jgi:hypothetical protein
MIECPMISENGKIKRQICKLRGYLWLWKSKTGL